MRVIISLIKIKCIYSLFKQHKCVNLIQDNNTVCLRQELTMKSDKCLAHICIYTKKIQIQQHENECQHFAASLLCMYGYRNISVETYCSANSWKCQTLDRE